MKNIFEELWYGNISPINDSRKRTKESSELSKKLSDNYEKLLKNLNEEQRKLLEEYDECNIYICEINEREIFEYSFRLGMRLAIETMNE